MYNKWGHPANFGLTPTITGNEISFKRNGGIKKKKELGDELSWSSKFEALMDF